MNDNEYVANKNCEEFEQRIQWLFDERLPLRNDSQLDSHAVSCADCAHLLTEYRLLASSWSLPSQREPISGWIQSWRFSPIPFSTNSVAWWLCTAALLLVTVGMLVNQKPGPDRIQGDFVAANFGPSTAFVDATNAGSSNPKIQATNADFSSSVFFDSESLDQSIYGYTPTLLNLARSTPRLVTAVSFRSNPLEKISTKLDPLNPYIRYSAELPGVRPLQNSFNIAIDLLQRSWSKPVKIQPDLGRFSDLRMFAAV